MTLQFRLRELMAKRERETGEPCTYDTIYRATKISPNTLSTLANNKIKMVGVSVLARLLDYFRCEPNDLMVNTSPHGHKKDPAMVKGKYAHLPTSSEDFARRKQEEIELEAGS